MENKLPNPEDFFKYHESGNYRDFSRTNFTGKRIVEIMKMYGEKVRNYTLQVASENAECESGAIIDMGFEIISASVNKDSILNLKNSKELEI